MELKYKIEFNPIVPDWMDNKDIEQRDSEHLENWWNKPYIVTETYEKEPYKDYFTRLTKFNGKFKIESLEEYELNCKKKMLEWFESWKNGVRYDVRMLDGGSWDRTTWHGSFDNFHLAMNRCKELMENKS